MSVLHQVSGVHARSKPNRQVLLGRGGGRDGSTLASLPQTRRLRLTQPSGVGALPPTPVREENACGRYWLSGWGSCGQGQRPGPY